MNEAHRFLESSGVEGRSGVFRLDKNSWHNFGNDVGLKLVESLFVAIQGRRLRFCAPGSDPCRGEAGQQFQGERYDGYQTFFEYHRLNAREKTICLNTGGSMYFGADEMIGFDMDLELSREYCDEKHLRLALGRAPASLVAMQLKPEGSAGETVSSPLEKEDALKARQAFFSVSGEEGDGAPEKIRVYDLDHGGWLEPKDPLFDMLSPTLALSASNTMLFRFGAAGFGELRFYKEPSCAV